LNEYHPGFKLKIYDAYRPIEVQAFMVEHVADAYCRRIAGILLSEAEDEIRQRAYDHAHDIWAPAVDDFSSPPPHSTGAAADVTIVDARGRELDMGSLIDEHENASPESFVDSDHPEAGVFHRNRELLSVFMESGGFARLPHEWWHFSLGDQNEVFSKMLRGFLPPDSTARYGRFVPKE
jgi:D-alanyl-D-alanine dipeptidase